MELKRMLQKLNTTQKLFHKFLDGLVDVVSKQTLHTWKQHDREIKEMISEIVLALDKKVDRK